MPPSAPLVSLPPMPAPTSRPPLERLVPPPCEDHPPQEALPLADAVALPRAIGDLDPEAEQAAGVLVRALAEVLTGRRPAAQVRPALVPRVAHVMEHLVRSGAAEGMHLAGVRLQSPRDGVVEASARLASPRRAAAFAFRVERRPRRWAVTVIEAALDPQGRLPARA